MRNVALDRLRAGDLSLGVILRQARSVEIGPVMETAGFDWLLMDLEHNTMSLETVGEISVGCLGTGISPIVRVPVGGSISQQMMTTGVIAGNIEEAARGTVEVTKNISNVSVAISNSNTQVDQVLGSARELSREGVALGSAVDEFLGSIRAA